MRFINVFNEERLVVWIGRYKLQANLARFQRTPVSEVKNLVKDEGGKKGSSNHMNKKVNEDKYVKISTSSGNSFVQAVKGDNLYGGGETELFHAVVLDDECLVTKDLSKSLLGRVKEFACLANLKVALCNEGFVDIKIHYVGELWVMLEFGTQELIKLFRDNVRASETPGWVPDFADESDDEYQEDDTSKNGGSNDHDSGSGRGELEMEEVLETLFLDDRLVKNDMEEGGMDEQENKSKDPFQIYPLLEKKNNSATKDNISVGSLKYPIGFTPHESSDVDCMHVEGDKNVNVEEVRVNSVGVVNDGSSGNRFNKNSKEDSVESVVSGHFKVYDITYKGLYFGSEGGVSMNFLSLNIQGLAQKAKKDWVKELCIKYKSDSIGNSGGILCVWDKNSFVKHNVTILDYFVMVRGVWRSTGQLVLLITIYALHNVSEKQMLWDFLQWEISKWTGDVVIMGDFNEVRYKSDRFGSVFNAHGASLFNSFIRSSGLVEVNLGGSSFTWCHKFATKMSKLDRFLVFERFLNTCSNINVITLERYMSDHRPILLRESHVDYGPTPFWFFHYWLEMEGSCKVVEDGWKESPCDSSNAMRNFLGKLKHLKKVIRVWNKTNTINVNNIKARHKIALEAVDSCIDKGNGTEEDVKRRVEILNKIPDIDKLKSLEMAQKAKKRDMECEVANDEIKKAVWDCGTDKASGPDGFTFGFYRRFWYLIDNDFYDAVGYFFIYDDILKGCNSSFIALIPKIPDANMVKDFIPISLVGSLYKIIAKILANRLVGVLGDIVSEVQSAFIADRHILDGSFIMNEVLQWCKVKKKQALIIKVDFEKSYDSVRWDFLDEILSKFGFGEQWFDTGMFHGLQLGGLVNLSHMFYEDDAVFSKIMGVHVNRDKVNRVAMKLGCLVLKAPFLYLGSMVGGAMSKANAWSEVVDRVKNRLSKWKMKTLSIGGRLTLLKSVLGSMPIFHMSMFKVSSGVLRPLESLRSRFFNGHDTNSRKASWVKWKTVLASKERGGLDVSSLYALNRGLLFKWIWRRAGKRSCWLNIIHEVKALLNMGIDLKKYMHSFRIIPRGGAEQQQFNEMVDLVTSISIAAMLDRLVWELQSSGEFTVASVRKLIDDIWLPRSECKMRWIKYVPIKINVHAWKGVETSNYLFFSCCLVRQVSRLIMRWWDVPEFESYEGWLSWLVNLRLPHKNKLLLEGVFYVTWWLLWIFRNKTIFETKVPLKVTFFDDAV
nr:RNA-directed DNA polymerase, eukaryota, reverse transcriptase zinc-binding domain protein [Tanacetum cinerariifolium]